MYDLRVPDRPIRASRAEPREVIELRAVKARHPELAGAADMHIELLELQRRIQGRIPLPWFHVDAGVVRRHQQEGRPLVRFEDIPIELSDLRLLVRQTAEVLHRFDALDAGELQLLVSLGRDGELMAVAGEWYRRSAIQAAVVGPGGGAQSGPVAGVLQHEVVGQVLALALRPYLARCAEVLQRSPDLGAWPHPYCPLCGGEPDLAVLTSATERELVCGQCLLRWPFDAQTCPRCLNRDRNRFTSFTTGDGLYRVDACNACRRYMKAFDVRRATRPFMAVLDGVAMLPLDAAAQQQGYTS